MIELPCFLYNKMPRLILYISYPRLGSQPLLSFSWGRVFWDHNLDSRSIHCYWVEIASCSCLMNRTTKFCFWKQENILYTDNSNFSLSFWVCISFTWRIFLTILTELHVWFLRMWVWYSERKTELNGVGLRSWSLKLYSFNWLCTL